MSAPRVLRFPSVVRDPRDEQIRRLVHGPDAANLPGEQHRLALLLADLVATGSISEPRALRAYALLHLRFYDGESSAQTLSEFRASVYYLASLARDEYAGRDVVRIGDLEDAA